MREWLERKLEKNLVPTGYVFSALGSLATFASTRIDSTVWQSLAAERSVAMAAAGFILMKAGLQIKNSSPEPPPEGRLVLAPDPKIELAEAA